MKRRFPVFILIIPIGALVMLLALILTLNLDRIVSALGSSVLGAGRGNLPLVFYIALALIPVISGTIMGLAIALLSKKEDEEYQRLREESRIGAPSVYEELFQSFDSIDASIAKLRDISEEIQHQAEAVEELGRYLTDHPDTVDIKTKQPEIYSLTMGDCKITNLRVVHPVDGLVPQEPVLSPQSHQKIWFFPRK
ncbi:MAG: hypothetical protein LBG10_07300 [Treponema sp.]|jgi:hypothetical protein|nr:hypothetical protein [Treponema sp.]